MLDKEKEFYDRHLRLENFGIEAQNKLKQSKVLVVGAGGLGCPVLQYLTAAGVGNITILDDDVVSLSNLQRQILYSVSDIGKPKVDVAKEKLSALNPFITINSKIERLTPENALELIKNKDLVIDCSDNFATRYLVNDACVILGVPFIYGALSRFDGQVSVFNYQNGPTYRCLFPEIPDSSSFPSCSEEGVLGVVPGIIGTLQAVEAIKMLTNIGKVLSGELLLYSALNNNFTKLKINPVEENRKINQLSDYSFACSNSVNILHFSELKQLKDDYLLIDVRSETEHKSKNIGGTNIPLEKLSDYCKNLKTNQKIVIYCQSGKRSMKAAEILQSKGFFEVFSLEGGLVSISQMG